MTVARSAPLLFIILANALFGNAELTGQQARTDRDQLKRVVIDAFKLVHRGFSSDEVILQTGLNDAFIAACNERLPGIDPFQFNWTLLNLRKAGKLPIATTKRVQSSQDDVTPIAEMCARMMEDKHGKSIDRLISDPETRQQFDDASKAIDQYIDPVLVRRAAFRLRKTRQLKPELITRIADWGRVVSELKASDIAKHPEIVPDTPGIYIFRNADGYLYIGEAKNLRARLTQHLGNSDRRSLANYFESQGINRVIVEVHSFDPDSRIKEVMIRRAYESELIRSRKPRFNIRP